MNLGGYDTNDFNEASGNIILKDFLHKNEMLFCHFSEQDKTPNFDGYFEILEKQKNKSTPIGSVNVQIKTLNSKYINENKKLTGQKNEIFLKKRRVLENRQLYAFILSKFRLYILVKSILCDKVEQT